MKPFATFNFCGENHPPVGINTETTFDYRFLCAKLSDLILSTQFTGLKKRHRR